MKAEVLDVIVIDDDAEGIAPLLEELESNRRYAPRHVDFNDFERAVCEKAPDIVVLDLMRDEDQEIAGRSIYEWVWESRFCPIVVYSADPTWLAAIEHSCIKSVQKGADSEPRVVKCLDELISVVDALRSNEAHVVTAVRKSVQSVTSVMEPQNPQFTDTVMRQIAAQVDTWSRTQGDAMGIPMYVYPAVENHLLTGDLLRESEAHADEPAAYRLVLSPSCDLARGDDRSANLSHVLVARCEELFEGIGKKGERVSYLKRSAAQGHDRGHVLLPEVTGMWPHMHANLRSLELLALDSKKAPDIVAARSLGEERRDFVRVASVDSPYREMITWAYLTIAGRVGLPQGDPGWAQRTVKAWDEQNRHESG